MDKSEIEWIVLDSFLFVDEFECLRFLVSIFVECFVVIVDFFLFFLFKKSNSIILVENTDGIYEFDPTKNQLKHLTPFPESRQWKKSYYTAVTIVENFILFCGGETTDETPVSEILLYSLSNTDKNFDRWIHFKNQKLPKPITYGTSLYIPSLQIVILVCGKNKDTNCYDLQLSKLWNCSKWMSNFRISEKILTDWKNF